MFLTRFLLAATLMLFVAATVTAQAPMGRGGDRGPQDQDADGIISRAEFDAWADSLFTRLDQNEDGQLSEDEHPVHHLRRQARKSHGPAMGARALTKLADEDQDGAIGAVEWQSFLASLEVDSEGIVDPASLAERLPFPTHRSGRFGHSDDGETPEAHPRAGRFLSHAFDVDGDRTLELSDFEDLFSALDTNEDGQITQDEAPSFGPRHGQRRGGPSGS